MKLFRLLFVAIGATMMFSACSDTASDDKRAAKIVDEIRNPKSKNVLVVCHRGDWRNFPENSIPAIESVIEMGADVVELDIQLTKDSVLVLMHDGTIDRCTTGKGRVADLTYEELQKFYMKTAHGTRCSLDLKVPTLREALEVCKDRIVINIDKGYNHYGLVLALAEEMGMTEQILIKGSSSLASIREKMAANKQNLLYMPIITPTNAKSMALFEEYIADDEPQLAYEICWGEYTPEVESAMQRLIADGSKLWVNSLWNSLCGGLSDDVAWVTSADEVYGKLVDMGATMIQTDRPKYLLEYLRERGLHD
ncbi:MAG: glycerophosphodiester phosphodiesterase family protein [Alistipes sp.]|nr:glycerophosphodiester phosphodiesterase family protein [Alistipes sp.]MBR7096961.1 glycerophosphodiester phosphodiesterase family protein [Alistipes sp.]